MEKEIVENSEGECKSNLETRTFFLAVTRLLNHCNEQEITTMVRFIGMDVDTRSGSWLATFQPESLLVSIMEDFRLVERWFSSSTQMLEVCSLGSTSRRFWEGKGGILMVTRLVYRST